MTLALKTLEIAISQLGVEESPRGSNSGKTVELYLSSVGLGKGYAWCMAFVYWCADKSSKELAAINPLFKTPGVLDQWNHRPKLRVIDPQPGDVFIMDFGKGAGHTGFVERVLPGNKIQTIEGNSNNTGSREGYVVCRHTRNISTIKGFIRLS